MEAFIRDSLMRTLYVFVSISDFVPRAVGSHGWPLTTLGLISIDDTPKKHCPVELSALSNMVALRGF